MRVVRISESIAVSETCRFTQRHGGQILSSTLHDLAAQLPYRFFGYIGKGAGADNRDTLYDTDQEESGLF